MDARTLIFLAFGVTLVAGQCDIQTPVDGTQGVDSVVEVPVSYGGGALGMCWTYPVASANPVQLLIQNINFADANCGVTITQAGTPIRTITIADSADTFNLGNNFDVILQCIGATGAVSFDIVASQPTPATVCASGSVDLIATDVEQFFTSPGYPGGQTTTPCAYTITTQEGDKTISLVCDWVDLSDDPANQALCSDLFEVIIDGVITTICDKRAFKDPNYAFISTGDTVTASFTGANQFQLNTGFVCRYYQTMEYTTVTMPPPGSPVAYGSCSYDAASMILTMKIVVEPGDIQPLYKFYAVEPRDPVSLQFTDLACVQGTDIAPDTYGNLEIEIDVLLTDANPATLAIAPLANQDPTRYCAVTVETNADGENEVVLRAAVQQLPGLYFKGDAVWRKTCQAESTSLSVETDVVTVRIEERPSLTVVPETAGLMITDENGVPLTGMRSLDDDIYLLFTMEDTRFGDGDPVAARLRTCDVRPERDSLTPIIEFVDDDGCATDTVPFGVPYGFQTFEDASHILDVDPDTSGTRYYALVGPMPLGQFLGHSPTLYFRCLYDMCNSYGTPGIPCQADHCQQGQTRRKREASGQNETEHVVTTAIILKLPSIYSGKQDTTRTETPHEVEKLEDCFESWIFVVVVVVMVILLVLAVLVSFFLLFQLNRNKQQRSKEAC